ncbi:hypothetical protein G9A89_018072 [Geosiphon pyriformis]|nr:hypothetical protein G9A89_018072 [Geosiphon pyriformis]
MNGSSELDSKLEKFIPNSKSIPKSKPTRLPTSDAVIHLSVFGVPSSNLLTTATSDLSTTAATNNLSIPTNPNTAPKLTTQWNPKTKNDSIELEIGNSSPSTDPQFFTAIIWITPAEFGLLITPEDASTNNLAFTQKQPLTSNIPSAIITEDESLAAIFSFEFEETAATPLFSGAALKAKPITTMYTNTKVEGQSIKLILDSGSAGSIITQQLMEQLALIGNDWLFKVNATLDWNTQKLQLTYQDQHMHVPATCGHFKTPPREKLLIELEEEKEKPTWEAYQVLWANEEHNELPPILPWDNNNNGKGKQKEKLTWETDDLT